jgi:hypothetical protein
MSSTLLVLSRLGPFSPFGPLWPLWKLWEPVAIRPSDNTVDDWADLEVLLSPGHYTRRVASIHGSHNRSESRFSEFLNAGTLIGPADREGEPSPL